MTQRSIKEYAEVMRRRYLKANRREKGRLLDEFVQVTGYHRKSAIRILLGRRGSSSSHPRGRPRRYGLEAALALKTIWEISDCLCSRRLKPFMAELISILKHHGEFTLGPEVEAQLCQMSPSTMDRLLRPYRCRTKRRSLSTTRPGNLRTSIPIRTSGEHNRREPGFLQIDLVAHCGESTEGFYLTTLDAVDLATGWTELRAVWGKGQERVKAAIHEVTRRLPFAIKGLHSDNGSEFINHLLYSYCQREGIEFTRGRSHNTNDNAHVEQRNWSAVRRLVGYGRYDSRPALDCLKGFYELARLWLNFFQPVLKLKSKFRHGARVRKVYDTAQTPYQRLKASGILEAAELEKLERLYRNLNPIWLKRQMEAAQEQLWKHTKYPRHEPTKAEVLVTRIYEATNASR